MTAYVSEVWRLRHFWMALVRNDLRNRYRRSVLGLGWSLLQPIAMTAVLCIVFVGVFGQTLKDYAPYLLSGLTVWNFISTVSLTGCQSFFQSEAYLRQHRAPLAIYPLRTVLGAGYHFLIGLGVVLAAIALLSAFPALGSIGGAHDLAEQSSATIFGNPLALFSLVPTLVILLVFAWSLAVCTATLNVLFHDTQHLLEILLQILFYLTPIMYKPQMLIDRHLGWTLQLNPFAVLVDLVREPLLHGAWPTTQLVLAGVMIAAGMLATAAALLKWCERRLIFFM